MQDFLPVTKKEMQQRGWEQVDFVYLTGDAYVDHPSFGTAIISADFWRVRGYRVGIIPQPDWRKKESVQVFGEPRLGFLVSCRKYGFHGEPLHRVQESTARRIPILQAARWDCGRTCLPWCTAT